MGSNTQDQMTSDKILSTAGILSNKDIKKEGGVEPVISSPWSNPQLEKSHSIPYDKDETFAGMSKKASFEGQQIQKNTIDAGHIPAETRRATAQTC